MGPFTIKRVTIPELDEAARAWQAQQNLYSRREDQIILSYYGKVPARLIADYINKHCNPPSPRTAMGISKRYRRLASLHTRVKGTVE